MVATQGRSYEICCTTMGTWLPSQLPIVHKNSLQSRRTDTALPVQYVRTFRYRYRYSMSVLLTCTAMEPATHCLASFHAQVPFENLIEPATHCFACSQLQKVASSILSEPATHCCVS